MNIQVANRLVTLRRKHGLSQEQLAEKLGISRQAVSKWERAESSPDTDNLIALARLYKVSLDALVEMDEESAEDERYAVEHAVEQVLECEQAADGEQVNVEQYAESDVSLDDMLENVPVFSTEGVEDNGAQAIVEVSTSGHCKAKGHGIRWSDFPFPAIVGGVYLLMGFLYGLWHPGWVIFMTIPIYYTAVEGGGFNFNKVPFALVVAPIYLLIGSIWNLWHPGWMLFLTIPIYYSMEKTIIGLSKDGTNIPVLAGLVAMLVLMGIMMGLDKLVWLVLIVVAVVVIAIFNRPEKGEEG